ncbi:MAG: type III-A CRISPR-associated RAMP protein Csm3 [Clostridia bacterium]|nr:type III-A CRISPR-associated RAMP protein Csm3 [Clostridia bacterium]
MDSKFPTIKEKIMITGQLTLESGLHIGTSGDFSPIGAVDSIVVRDPVTRRPIIPGSSIKGKLRSLMAAAETDQPWLPNFEDEGDHLQRLFGSGGKNIRRSRLQFFDLFMEDSSVKNLERADTDLYLTEIKFENSIQRLTGVANPRQMERVPAGAVFNFKLTYMVEDPDEFLSDMKNLGKGLRLLQLDYLGKGGSRGNGRVRFSDIDLEAKLDSGMKLDLEQAKGVLASAIET